MSRWLVLTLVFAHILVTVVACLATILLYFLLRQKQRQYAAATRQAKALVEKYEKRKTDRRELSTQLDKEAWIQRQKMKSLQEQVEKLEKNIQSVQREKEELELRLKQVTDARDKLLQVSKVQSSSNSSQVVELRTDKQTQEEPVTCEQDTQTIRSTTKSADCSANPILDCEDSNHWLVYEAENISVQDDSECEYDFILHDNNTSTQNEMIPPQQG